MNSSRWRSLTLWSSKGGVGRGGSVVWFTCVLGARRGVRGCHVDFVLRVLGQSRDLEAVWFSWCVHCSMFSVLSTAQNI